MMKPSSHDHVFILPTGRWLQEATAHWAGYSPEEVIISYFEQLRFVDSNGWDFSKHNFTGTVHMLVTLMISDLEGASPVPQEFDIKEIDRLEAVARHLTLELMRVIHSDCWQHQMRLNYVRLIGYDIVIHYVANYPFQLASPSDLPPMYDQEG